MIEELVHGSSLICGDEGKESQQECIYRMHWLVRRFILSDMERDSGLWNKAYSIALIAVHERVESELKKENKSFEKLPDVFGNNRHEVMAHTTALVDHHTLPVLGTEIRNVSEVEDIHRYSGMAIKFIGKTKEDVHVLERLLVILRFRKAAKRSRSCIQRLVDMRNRQCRGDELKSRIAVIYIYLADALMSNGKFNDAASKLE